MCTCVHVSVCLWEQLCVFTTVYLSPCIGCISLCVCLYLYFCMGVHVSVSVPVLCLHL